MDIFPKIAKTILIVIIGIIIYSFVTDFGKTFVVDSQNSYIARNASSYTSKFTVDEKVLLEFKEKSITTADASKTLQDYFDMQFKNLGYSPAGATTGSKMKLVYTPDAYRLADGQNYSHLGPVYVRIMIEGFDGTVSRLGDPGVGLIIINIEQKIPTSFRSLLKSMGNTTTVADNEGFWGYYSVENEYAFTMNVLKKAF